MNSNLQDTIEREIVIHAPRERVYAALSDPAQIVRWFPEGIEGKLEPGERPILDFGKYGKFSIYVVAAEPNEYFAYRWLPGSAYVPKGFIGDVLTKPHTLVEFHVKETPGGTRLQLKESGFASLPTEHYAKSIKENNDGWDFMLDRLKKLLS
jgi:uncharacterized protein YndB with AHSA1/START domain